MQLKTLLVPFVLAEAVLSQSVPIRIMSFNIRYATSSLESGEKPWWDLFCGITKSRCRQRYVLEAISDAANAAPAGAAVIVGLQEALNNQKDDIQNGLGDGWSHLGVGRDDGKKAGEFSVIFYRNDALRLLYQETKWLSPTPDVVSYGWGAGSRRIVTIGVFEHIATGKRFIHANTHLDNVSDQARSEGIKVVVSRIQAVQSTYGPLGVTLTGDFNSDPNGSAYRVLANGGFVEDLYNKAPRVGSLTGTYTTFDTSLQNSASRIDFIWLGPQSANKYSVQKIEIKSNIASGVVISDHRPVVGDVTLLS
ncbi:endonuclease/Exonuclease/phosphatase [Colletotrichum graminicola]|uniref:Endonuclease/Exonuclease/phosphatase n=1 Tax=Colletotrichum graminicola (strain M1.001 / M2 / FGSC 10212) TaxID=645133 RepID=E3Q5G0_COLGM|nr:endonuclease/Exonuclease/phosphatase [Colletotrichum graminicola M1.001]EFQ25927.1 endonuclease/Exonuclease/phosphatase [Colletotrichum graminicola M1.001]WDK23047.1 endonuclease/Exonuclease/phosphatase [Colletotrichum graminicola]